MFLIKCVIIYFRLNPIDIYNDTEPTRGNYKIYARSAARKSYNIPSSFNCTIVTSTELDNIIILTSDLINNYVKLISSYSYGECILCGRLYE